MWIRLNRQVASSTSDSILVGRQILQLFCKEAVIWKHLSHPHIVPFIGVTLEPLQLVSKWMPGGDLRYHVRKNSNTDRISLVSRVLLPWDAASFSPQLIGVARGLTYPTRVTRYMGISKEYVVSFIPSAFFKLTDANSAEHHGRRIGKGTDHGLRSRCRRPKSTLPAKHSR